MVDMGTRFHTPRRRSKQWAIIEDLVRRGMWFRGPHFPMRGNTDRPHTKREARAWVDAHEQCRWCDQSLDSAHGAILEAARPWNWYHRKYSSSIRGEKK